MPGWPGSRLRHTVADDHGRGPVIRSGADDARSCRADGDRDYDHRPDDNHSADHVDAAADDYRHDDYYAAADEYDTADRHNHDRNGNDTPDHDASRGHDHLTRSRCSSLRWTYHCVVAGDPRRVRLQGVSHTGARAARTVDADHRPPGQR